MGHLRIKRWPWVAVGGPVGLVASWPGHSSRLAESTRRRHVTHAIKAQHTQFLVDMLARKPFRAAPWRLMSFAQEIAHSIIDMFVNGPIRRCESAMGEVSSPTAQEAIQSSLHLRPRTLVARRQQVADFRLDPLHALLGRACAQIPTATVGKVAWSQRIAKEIEAFPPGVLHRGFRLVECQPEFRHHRLRPRQRLFRMSAAEDDKVVGVRDDMCAEHFATSTETPMLQEPVHVNHGEQRTDDSTLRRAAFAALAATHAPLSVAIPLFDWRFQP